jgi:multicomponent Na+:H+ antiporter subunit G
MKDLVVLLFLFIGGLFTLIAAIGIVRMPDLFTRMQASTKAATLGVGCVMIAAAAFFADLVTSARALLTTVFLFSTAPVAAHTIGRAAYFVGVALWEGTVTDELRDRYDRDTHRLRSRPLRDAQAGRK